MTYGEYRPSDQNVDDWQLPLERIAPPLGFSLLAWLRVYGWPTALVLLVAWWLV